MLTSLLLILLFGKPLPLRHTQILKRPVRILIRHIIVARKLGIDHGIRRDPTEGHIAFRQLRHSLARAW